MNMMLLFPDKTPQPERRVSSVETEEMLDRLLAAPFVDVTQVPMHHAPRVESGEARLALAILEDALRCVLRHSDSRIPRQRAEAREARAWIESDVEDYALAFVPICQLFDVDPEWIRDLIGKRLGRAAACPKQPIDGHFECSEIDEVFEEEIFERQVA